MSLHIFLFKFPLIFILGSMLTFFAHAQSGDSVFTCRGRVDQDQRKLILLNLQFKLGGLMLEGDLNGDPIVGSNFGTGNLVQAVAYPKSQDTGNTRDIKHKMTANINKLMPLEILKLVCIFSFINRIMNLLLILNLALTTAR